MLRCKNKSLTKIGQGAYGTIYMLNKNGRMIVLKVAKDADAERAKHLILWNTIPDACRRYFPKPLNIPSGCKARKNYGLHAMEYVQGVNMQEYIVYNLKIGNKKQIRLVTKLLQDAIMCLWRSGFLHMDLHMKNIIVTKTGIKIIDFGMTEVVTPLKTPKSKAQVIEWFTNRYKETLNKLGFNATNPNLYAYGIKTHKMFYKPNQKLYNTIHKIQPASSLKL